MQRPSCPTAKARASNPAVPGDRDEEVVTSRNHQRIDRPLLPASCPVCGHLAAAVRGSRPCRQPAAARRGQRPGVTATGTGHRAAAAGRMQPTPVGAAEPDGQAAAELATDGGHRRPGKRAGLLEAQVVDLQPLAAGAGRGSSRRPGRAPASRRARWGPAGPLPPPAFLANARGVRLPGPTRTLTVLLFWFLGSAVSPYEVGCRVRPSPFSG
jgi:hypothetical protein